MSNLVKLTDEISYLPATRKPLSCDIIIITPPKTEGKEQFTWIYDVGANKESRDLINSIKGNKIIVLSHFHPDHVLNLPFIKMTDKDLLIVSKNTKKYVYKGTVFEDCGENVLTSGDCQTEPEIFALPSSHAKGCLCLQYKDYCFMGDGTYCKEVILHHTYNVQLLNEEIKVLEKRDCKYYCLDHDPVFKYTKDELVALHKQIYARAEKNKATISVEDFFNPDGSVKVVQK